jgi:type VI secretion system secreted protein VgrG
MASARKDGPESEADTRGEGSGPSSRRRGELRDAAEEMVLGAPPPAIYTLEVKGVEKLALRAVEGLEALSRPFRFEAALSTDAAVSFDPDAVVGLEATLRIERDGEIIRSWKAVLQEAWMSATGKAEGHRHPAFHFVLAPKLVELEYKIDARVFVDRTVPEIVAEVLNDGGIVHAFRLSGSYDKRPYCVQYRESDFDFVSRLLEDEGIFYRFADDEEGTMILGDAPMAYDPKAKEQVLPFRPATALDRERDHIFEIGSRARLAASKVSLRDWNAEKPSLDMDVSAAASTPSGVEFYDWGGKYAVPQEGQRKARLIAESLDAEGMALVGVTRALFLAPGRTLGIEDAPAGVADGSYVVTKRTHDFHASERCEVAFEALPATVTFRPARVTPAPLIEGVLTGFVMGPDGADIHTDEYGRVKVRFPWDRRSLEDDTASNWIPVLQDNTGSSLAIPRLGWEVAVAFVEGDPDRPVVLGRVYNGADPFPETLPDNKTVSTLKSVSSPGRGGSNQIRMEDKGGAEQMYVQAEKDQNVVVANDKDEKVLNTEANTIGGDETFIIGANNTLKVGMNRQLNVKGDQTLTIAANRTRKVSEFEKTDVAANHTLAVASSHTRRIDGMDAVTTAGLKEKVGVLDLEVSLKPNKTDVGKAEMLTVGGAVVEIAGKNKSEKCAGRRQETIGALVYTRAVKKFKVTALTTRSTKVGALLQVSSGKNISLIGTEELTAEAADVKLLGDLAIEFHVGDGASKVILDGDELSIDTSGDIVIEATGSEAMKVPKAVFR